MKDINMLYKWVSVILFMMLTPFCLNAQWSFRMHTSASGNCPDQGLINSIAGKINEAVPDITGFATRAECEAARAAVSYSYTLSGCTVRVTATPCVGRDVGGASVAGIGAPSVGASTQGGSFFYTNMSDAIKSWQDEQDRIDQVIGNRDPSEDVAFAATSDVAYNTALNQDIARHTYSSDSGINIGNGVFKGIPSTPLKPVAPKANMENVMSFIEAIDDTFLQFLLLNPSQIYSLLPQKFKELSKFDIDAIINKNDSSRTPEERQAIDDYNAFVKEVCNRVSSEADKELARINSSKEKKASDMALLAALCYGKEEDANYNSLTDYRVISKDDEGLSNSIKNLADVIDYCNSTGEDTGFHAELYYNSLTGEYSIAIEGSSDLTKILADSDAMADWLHNNIYNGMQNITGSEIMLPQFTMIESIAIALNSIGSDENINITGHSLGGGLASYLGLLTGRDTYTFNPEGLNKNLLENVERTRGVIDESKISVFCSSGDVLTNIINPKARLYVPGGKNKEILKDASWHPMAPLADSILDKNRDTQNRWADIHALQNAINRSVQDSSLYRQDNINIITY